MQRVLSFPTSGGRPGDPGEHVTKRICCSSMFSAGFLCLLVGFLLGRFAFDQELAITRRLMRDSNATMTNRSCGPDVNESRIDEADGIIYEQPSFSADQLLDNQRSLWMPLTTPHRKKAQASELDKFMRALGFDMLTSLKSTSISLVGPDALLPNQVIIKDGTGATMASFQDKRPSQYSSSPTLTTSTNIKQGEPIYVNFGRDEDYHHLDSIGINVAGRVVLARIGESSITDIVMTSLNHDCLGVLLFVDPQQETLLVKDLMPPALQAELHLLYVASMAGVVDDSNALPVSLISAFDAESILRFMVAKEQSPTNWRGELNCSYPIGPGFSTSEWSVEMTVNNVHQVEEYYDIVGVLRGSQEPDRVVLLGGNLDEDSEYLVGASALKAVAMYFSEQKAQGWTPYRTVAVAFWGKRPPSFPTEVFSYLDFDFEGDGSQNQTGVRGSLLLSGLFEKTSRKFNMSHTLQYLLPAAVENELDSSGVPFLTFDLASTGTVLLDDATEISELLASLAMQLSSNAEMPFALNPYLKFFHHSISVLNQRFQVVARRHKLFLETLTETVDNLTTGIKRFQSKFISGALDGLALRRMSDRITAFTRALACRRDSDNPILLTRHPLFSSSATSPDDTTAGFGELQDLLRAMTSALAPTDLQRQIVTLVTDIVRCLNSADESLSDGLDRILIGRT